MQKTKYYRCPECRKVYNSLTPWSTHMMNCHSDVIPEGWTPARYFYYLKTKKDHGSCIICKHDTEWLESRMKYARFCNNPKCKESYREQFKNRMISKHGVVTLLNDPEQQRKMLLAKKNSGYYELSDGTKIEYLSSYEQHFSMILDHLFRITGNDIMGPSPHTYYYNYTNENDKENEGRKFYIPDYFIPSMNLEIEIKQNTSTHPKILKIDKVKEKEKDEMMKSIPGINYLKITDKNYDEFFKFMIDYKSRVVSDDTVEEGDEN